MNRFFIFLIGALLSASAFAFDHSAFDALLKKHVVLVDGGKATKVNYGNFAKDRAQLKSYLDSISKVSATEYKGWNKNTQLAFLINAYNAYTIELILTKYPDLKSIKDLGGTFSSPWKKKFFTLLGEEKHLDDVEHGMIRADGVFNEPRIHFVVNCASIGCPALRNDAITADKLESQLEDSTKKFLADRSRNRIADGNVQISKIFDWYGKDFAKGWKGYTSLNQFLAKYADALTENAADRQALAEGKLKTSFLDYDWGLNLAR
ncbi:MAG: hypothetical protein RL341_287 [Pseudomonadota bacterium]|jgi:hypothetical protein